MIPSPPHTGSYVVVVQLQWRLQDEARPEGEESEGEEPEGDDELHER